MFDANKIREVIKNKPARSTWEYGVKVYALELLEGLEEKVNGEYINREDLESPALLKKALLNGAADWSQYSWETWLDVQTRALYQAARWIINAARA